MNGNDRDTETRIIKVWKTVSRHGSYEEAKVRLDATEGAPFVGVLEIGQKRISTKTTGLTHLRYRVQVYTTKRAEPPSLAGFSTPVPPGFPGGAKW